MSNPETATPPPRPKRAAGRRRLAEESSSPLQDKGEKAENDSDYVTIRFTLEAAVLLSSYQKAQH